MGRSDRESRYQSGREEGRKGGREGGGMQEAVNGRDREGKPSL